MTLRSHDDWASAIEMAREYILNEAARQGATVNYTQLAAWINRQVGFSIEAHSTAMDLLLEDLARDEYAVGRPMLTALVIQQGPRGIPGSGFFRISSLLLGRHIRGKTAWMHIRDEVWEFYRDGNT
jgi:hypothetical protein